VALVQGGAAVGGQVGGQGGGRAAGCGCGGRGAWAAPVGWGGRPAPGRGRGGGRAGSGPRFNRAELEHLIEIVKRVLPLGPNEWEQVAMQHCKLYPTHNRCVANLKRKFWDMCSHQPPTGDPTCPSYIVSAKRILRLIEERSYANNLDGEEADIGFDDVDAIDGGEDGAVVEAEEGGNEPNVQCRLFPNNLPVARPLVRTPSSASQASRGQNGPNDLMSIALATFMSNAKSEETGRQYRCTDWKRNWNNRQYRRKRSWNANKKSKN
jgi:hypothetical protein